MDQSSIALATVVYLRSAATAARRMRLRRTLIEVRSKEVGEYFRRDASMTEDFERLLALEQVVGVRSALIKPRGAIERVFLTIFAETFPCGIVRSSRMKVELGPVLYLNCESRTASKADQQKSTAGLPSYQIAHEGTA